MAKNNVDLEKKLTTEVTKVEGTTPQSPKKNIAQLIESLKPQIEKALPKHLNADRLLRIALTSLRLNPKLMECNQASLLGAIMQSAQLGLEPNLLGQCYLIPYSNYKMQTTECQFIIGWKGLLELVRRSGQVSTIFAGEVKENDFFEFEYGLNHKLCHKPSIKESRGESYAYYAYAILKGGSSSFMVMSKQDVEEIRDRYSKSKNNGPWVTEFDAMAKKTVLKQLIKYLPLSVEILNQINADETTKTEITENMAENSLDIEFIPTEYVEAEVE